MDQEMLLSKAFVLEIEGMMCMKNCGNTVQNALRSMDGVLEAVVNYPEHIASVTIESEVDPNELIEMLDMVGFEAAIRDDLDPPPNIIRLGIDGMMCMKNCGTTVQNALNGVIGVESAIVNYEKAMATITIFPDHVQHITVQDLIDEVQCVGFDAYVYNHGERCRRQLAAKTKAQVDNGEELAVEIADSSHPRAFFSIEGMSCAACVKGIEEALRGEAGIIDIRVGLISAKAEVVFDRSIISNEKDVICNFIQKAGYTPTYINTLDSDDDSMEFKYSLTGITSTSNVHKVETCIKSLPGVVQASVDVEKQLFTVHIQQMAITGPRTVLDELTKMGFSAHISTKTDATSGMSEDQKWLRLLLICLIFSGPAMLIHMVLSNIPACQHWLMVNVVNGLTRMCLIMFLLATPVQFGIGARFYVAAYKGLQHGMMGMDFLIVVGTTASYLYSFVSMIGCAIFSNYHGHYFFESSTMLISFITIGKFLESRAKKDTATSLSTLLSLQAKYAVLIEPNGDRKIPIELVQRGDLLRLTPGSRVPTDGIIREGHGFCDESMITGESMPVAKAKGDNVFGSTINQNGVMIMESKCVGGQNTLSQICALIENAQMDKAPIQTVADKFASRFAPTVICISIITFFGWFGFLSMGWVAATDRESLMLPAGHEDDLFISILFAISTVVISCPCALGLATPTAVSVGTGVGSKYGVLIKGGRALETAHAVDTIVFDKTGTLTEGRPVVTDVTVPKESIRAATDILYYAACVETQSEHVLGKAIVVEAVEQHKMTLAEPKDIHVVPGRGILAKVPSMASPYILIEVAIGNPEWMAERDIQMTHAMEIDMHKLEQDGKTVVCVALDGVFSGTIALADVARPEAIETMRILRNMGYEIWLVTGDNLRTATAVATTLGITHVKAIALPGQKVEQIKRIQSQTNPLTNKKRVVAMVGDGINDAPALAQADVGLAIGAGTEIALAQADMVLIKSNLRDVVTALDLSRKTFWRIKFNLFVSVIYNFVSIPLAAGMFLRFFHHPLPPACAGIMMALSSISVITSSLHLKLYRPPMWSTLDEKASLKRMGMTPPRKILIDTHPYERVHVQEMV
ncbi:copper-transporting ATPase [Thraustotheca clavata]|uniref:Copper-transporting ATPase n=1 Tax=Thraustotheca clavata TaxID=74557 RepID=A0A1W0A4I5_9STRA|nr:copper-transporting ATPase [Thraustotheca clavata]